jgi:hypothetical protein
MVYASPKKRTSDRGRRMSDIAGGAVAVSGPISSVESARRNDMTADEPSETVATRGWNRGPSVCGRIPSSAAYSFNRQ